ncbi:MAG: ribosome-associated translation inhibitor RaiA [Burkholderiales bacterium]|nr:ribosome-associated translation inhibitor RaiA [Burkholderiales bacterium]
MKDVRITSHGFTATTAIRTHVRKRLGFALDRLSGRIDHVSVTLTDVNGPRHGVDKSCLVRIVAAGRELVCATVDSDVYRLIDRAAERAGRLLRRDAARSIESRRTPRAPARRLPVGFA